MAANGDIVFSFGADVGPLVAGTRSGSSALDGMEKAGRDLERQLQRIGQAGVDFQKKINAATGVTKQFGTSARASAEAFQAFDRARASVDSLRASIDPAFASSKRYEAAVQQLDTALEMGAITARDHASTMQQLAVAYDIAGARSLQMAGKVGGLGSMSDASRAKIQNMGFQLQDFAVQVGAGTAATTALGQQLPQLLSGFGLWGVALGTAAAVGVPLLGLAITRLMGETYTLDEAMKQLQTTTTMLEGSFDILELSTDELVAKYGEAADRVLQFALAQAELNAAQAGRRLQEEVSLLEEVTRGYRYAAESGRFYRGAIEDIQREFGLGVRAGQQFAQILVEIDEAGTFQEQQAALQKLITFLEANNVELAKMPPELQRAISEMLTLSNETDRAAAIMERLAAASQNVSVGVPLGQQGFSGEGLLPPVSASNAPVRSSGGGGGARDRTADDLERLQQQLMSEEEVQAAAYERQQETLQAALEKKLLTQQEYNSLMEQAQAAHQDEMAAIDAYRYGDGLQKTGQFLGDMANAFAQGNDKMQKAGKIFGAAEALVNAWRAYSQTLADPSLPFFAKFAAGASVLAAGMSAVSAIKGGSKSGGTGGGSVAAARASSSGSSSGGAPAAATPDVTQVVKISLTGDVIGRNGLDALFKQLDEGVKKGHRIAGYEFVG